MSNAKENMVLQTGLSNYYGQVLFCKVWCDEENDYKYTIELGGYDGDSETPITKELFDEATKIFARY